MTLLHFYPNAGQCHQKHLHPVFVLYTRQTKMDLFNCFRAVLSKTKSTLNKMYYNPCQY